MIVAFIIDDGSLITFMWWSFWLVWYIVDEVLNSHPRPLVFLMFPTGMDDEVNPELSIAKIT